MQVMQMAERVSFEKPEEVRTFPKGRVGGVRVGGAKTKSCEAAHFQYHVSGRLMVKMDDGTEIECRAGDVSLLPSGHDAWVVGNEPAVIVDFQGMVDWAKAH